MYAMKPTLIDNGGRRLGVDRRQFYYLMHIPEHESGKERRSGIDTRIYYDFAFKSLC